MNAHEWEKIEYRDNEYQFIEIFWCTDCGAIKKKITYRGSTQEISVRLPKKLKK